MSFATPGMTDVHQTTAAPNLLPTAYNASKAEPAFFSNTGELSFKPSVRIYCGNPDQSAASDTSDTDINRSVSTEIENKGKISTSYNVVHPETGKNLDLTLEQNAKLLAQMCLKSRAPAPHTYNSPYKSRLQSLAIAKEESFDNFATDAPQFERLVEEYLNEGEPEFEDWMELNPKRKLQSYSDAREMYEQVVLEAGGFGETVRNGLRNMREQSQKGYNTIKNFIKNKKQKESENTERGETKSKSEQTESVKNDSIYRLDELEEHTAMISTGLKQNHMVLKSKFEDIDEKHGKVAREVEHMGIAMLQNNKLIQHKVEELETRLQANENTIASHEEGLLNHHGTLQRMGSDIRAHTNSGVTVLPSKSQKQLSVSQLNRMAGNF